MRVFYDGDTYVSLPGGFKTLDYLVRVLLIHEMDAALLTKIVFECRGIYCKAFRSGKTGYGEAVG